MSAALDLPLLSWTPPATKAAALEQHERLHSTRLEVARSIARELAAKFPEIHVRMVRAVMVERGLLNPDSAASESWLGAVFRARDGWQPVSFHQYADTTRGCHSKHVRTWRLK